MGTVDKITVVILSHLCRDVFLSHDSSKNNGTPVQTSYQMEMDNPKGV